ncbi:MAG: diguanylate cyclase [Chloroflexi bacterium]|nr:diguanylate cyclase [Chloroflexota bacterium]
MMVVTGGLFAGTGFLAVRYRLRFISAIANVWLSWRKNQVNVGERMIIVGMDEGTQIASWLVQRNMFRTAFSVVGMVDHLDPTIYGMKVNGLWVLGSVNDLPALLQKHDVGVILSALPQNSPEIEYLFALQKAAPVRIIFLNDLLWIVDQQVTKPVGTMDFPLWLDQRMEYKALHDTLTELPNWTLFQDRLRHSLAFAKRNTSQRGFMFVELNWLQFAQDDLSRNALLKEIAARLNKAKRDVDTLARVNDERFALLLENVPDQLQLDAIQKRITCALSAPFKIWGKEINIQASISVNICKGVCGVEDDVRNANVNQCYECVCVKTMAIRSEVSL